MTLALPTEPPPAGFGSCCAGVVSRTGPPSHFPARLHPPLPLAPQGRERSGAMGGTLYIGIAWWGAKGGARRTRGSARAAGALAPCPQPLRFPPPPHESTWGPFATPGSRYLLLLSFFKEKKIILLKL